jgi:hypothetical protein
VIKTGDILALLGFLLGVITSVVGWLAWYGSSVRKRYAAERDFQHLKRNYEQLAANQGVIISNLKEVDERLGDIYTEVADLVADIQMLDVPRRGMRE